MTHRLMIKTHKESGLKYLCYTTKENYLEYTGSGKYWLRHLQIHGDQIETQVLFETDDYNKFKQVALETSIRLNVVESEEWANLRPEDGMGGSTTSNKMWITNGPDELYIEKDSTIPDGWVRGRSNKCAFKNPETQRRNGSKADLQKRGKAIKRAWDDGRVVRDHSKCGVRGNDNPAKRPEVRAKISKAQRERHQ